MLGKTLRGLGWLVSKLLMIVLAIVVILPYEATKWLYKRVYKDTVDYIGFSIFALAGSVYAAASGYQLAQGFGYGLVASGVAGFVAFLLAAAFIAPVLWMVLLRWIAKGFDRIWRGTNEFARKHFGDIASGLVSMFAHLPGSDVMWGHVNDPNRKSFVVRALGVLAYPCVVGSAGWFGYNILQYGQAFFHGTPVLSGIGTATGATVGVLVGLLLADVASKWLYYGKNNALGLTIGGGLAFGGAPFIAPLFGLSFTATAIAAVVAFALLVAYVVPGFILLFSDKFLNWVIEKLKPLLESAYNEKDSGSRHLFQQLTNFGVTALAAWGAWWLCGAIGLSVVTATIATVVTLALTYTVGGKCLDWEGGNFVIGGSTSAAVGITAGVAYTKAGFIYGNYGGVVAGVVAALPVFFLLFPLLYVAYRFVSTSSLLTGLTEWLGNGLNAVHKRVWKRFDVLVDRCQKVYNYAYRNERPYDKLVLHITNLCATAAVGFGLHMLLHGFASGHAILANLGVAAGTAIMYIAGGRYIVKSGLELLGAAWALGAGVGLGALVLTAQPLGYWFAIPFGGVVALLTYFLAYPLVFIGVRFVADPLLTGWLLPLLDGLHSWCWNTFATVFKGVRDFLAPIFGPIFNFIGGLFAGAWKMAVETWQSMFGHK
ncbi:MAG TPA: hypothetical protein V6C86_20760 [Oculatellaceae cyanobacterium]